MKYEVGQLVKDRETRAYGVILTSRWSRRVGHLLYEVLWDDPRMNIMSYSHFHLILLSEPDS